MTASAASQMNAVIVEGGRGPASALRLGTRAWPEPAEGEILIRVRAAGVNRPDVFQRLGLYPPPPGAPDTLGLEVAGEVMVEAGRWRPGDQVCALLGGGGYAEYAVCDARHALPVPASLSLEEAAALPETVFTVFANVMELGALRPGQVLLIHGATSGIGTTAIQMAKALGARVFATARSAEKAQAARALGADLAIDTSREAFAEVVTQAGGADVVLDMVGAEYFDGNLAALNTGGRIVLIAALGGGELKVPVLALMQKRAVVTGSTLRGRSADEKARLAAEIERVVWPWIADGRVRPQIDSRHPLSRAADAHARLEAGSHVGKILLVPA